MYGSGGRQEPGSIGLLLNGRSQVGLEKGTLPRNQVCVCDMYQSDPKKRLDPSFRVSWE